MKNNDGNKNNLSPEELEKISGGTDESKPNIDKFNLLKKYGGPPPKPISIKYGAPQLHGIDYGIKSPIEKLREEKNKKDAETTLLPKEPEKNN